MKAEEKPPPFFLKWNQMGRAEKQQWIWECLDAYLAFSFMICSPAGSPPRPWPTKPLYYGPEVVHTQAGTHVSRARR